MPERRKGAIPAPIVRAMVGVVGLLVLSACVPSDLGRPVATVVNRTDQTAIVRFYHPDGRQMPEATLRLAPEQSLATSSPFEIESEDCLVGRWEARIGNRLLTRESLCDGEEWVLTLDE